MGCANLHFHAVALSFERAFYTLGIFSISHLKESEKAFNTTEIT